MSNNYLDDLYAEARQLWTCITGKYEQATILLADSRYNPASTVARNMATATMAEPDPTHFPDAPEIPLGKGTAMNAHSVAQAVDSLEYIVQCIDSIEAFASTYRYRTRKTIPYNVNALTGFFFFFFFSGWLNSRFSNSHKT